MTELGALGPPPRSVQPGALLHPDSVAARLMLNPLTLLGGPRALLLQLAHPLVAAGVSDHSAFQLAPFDRLLRTLSALATVGFADPEISALALDELDQTHRAVRGRSPSGRPYAAGDPRLATWVHATIVDSYLVVERRWIGRLSDADRAAFYRETLSLGRAFGARVDLTGQDDPGYLPADLAGFETWMQARMSQLEVSEQARTLAPEVMHPPLSQPWGRPGQLAEHLAWPLMEALTADLLPPHLCRAYGLQASRGWSRRAGASLAGASLAGARSLTRGAAPLFGRAGSANPRPDRPTRVAAALTGQRI